MVHSIAKDFPDLKFTINGGISSFEQAEEQLNLVPNLQGVMLGRTAWHNPWLFRTADSRFYGTKDPGFTRREIIDKHLDYCKNLEDCYGNVKDSSSGQYGWSRFVMVRPLMYLFGGEPGSRSFKRSLSEAWHQTGGNIELDDLIFDALEHISEEALDALPYNEDKGKCN
mmetsp:Transcript_8780/g.10916  ORF Transcript_8780/g.10916 Transcript_8780/m.10916 type:complete len:169 (+) Transcript_8780:13-519(+)